MTRHIKILGICLTLFGCGKSSEKLGNAISLETTSQIVDSVSNLQTNLPDNSNQNIYDFMKIVIADQELDLSYGLATKPEQDCNLSQDDRTFLKTLLIEKSTPKNDTGNWQNRKIPINQLPKCLTKGDIDEMLSQKEKLSNFTWDNSRLGFSPTNNKNWYCFSRPLFSKDRKKVVMTIRNLCPGLCGTGWIVVFTEQNNKWTSQTGGQWMH